MDFNGKECPESQNGRKISKRIQYLLYRKVEMKINPEGRK